MGQPGRIRVFVYVDTSKHVGDVEHLKIFVIENAEKDWLDENDPQGNDNGRSAGLQDGKHCGRSAGCRRACVARVCCHRHRRTLTSLPALKVDR